MNILIENNSFTMDTRESRLTRLRILKENIQQYASELSITPEILDWANFAYNDYEKLISQQIQTSQDKNNKFNTINSNEREFFQRLISFREIISSKIKESNLVINLKLNEQIPSSRFEKYEFASDFINQLSTLSPNILDDVTILVLNNLKKQLKELQECYGKALQLQDDGTILTIKINKRFNQDSINLRTLYNWCVVFWNKKDRRLLDLGFSIPKSTAKNSNSPEKISNFQYQSDRFTWKSDTKSESYQVVYRNKFENIEWKILYAKDDSEFKTKLHTGEYKVRGINTYGFGQWSELIVVNENLELINE